MADMTMSDRQSRNQAVIDDFRSHDGQITSGSHTGRPLILLTIKGAKSGKERTTPLAYSRDGDRYVVIASKGGAPTNPDWFNNLLANPIVTVEVGPEKFQARASTAEGAERERLYAAHAAERPVFLEYQQKTSRLIPVVVLERLG
jgi:deazaflavin-dependent oxidoreductase (nitroreductase family)